MRKDKKNKYEKIAKITGIIIGLVLVLGISYAVFKTTTLSDKTNDISAGKLDLRIENEQEEISLENVMPETEEEGLKRNPYVFDVVNEGTINAAYDLYIEVGENTTLSTSVVRYYLTVEEDNEEKIVTFASRLLSSEEVIEKEGKKLYKIDRKYIDTNKTNKYKLYLWVDYDATVEEASNKYFEARVVIEGEQIYDKNRLIKQIDVSETGDNSVVAYMYADGTIYIKGKGTIISNVSDSLLIQNESILENYKRILIEAGFNEEEVNALSSIEEAENYVNNLGPVLEENFYLVIYKETLTEMEHDVSGITDIDTLWTFLVENKMMDESGTFTEEGELFFIKSEKKYNKYFSQTYSIVKNIVLEDGITNIPEGLFTGNEDITEVKIPSSVKTIDNNAFYGCVGLKEIVIPDSVTSIGDSAFENCVFLKNINILSDLVKINDATFSNCTQIKKITIPNTVQSIGNRAFYGCESLTEIEIPNHVKTLGTSVFGECVNLKEINIPNSIVSIGDAFVYHCKLDELIIPSSVEVLGGIGNFGTKKLTIDGTKGYGNLSVQGLEELVITGEGNMYNNDNENSIPWYLGNSTLRKVTIQEKITSIRNNAFVNCLNLTSIEIPNSVTSIGKNTFYNCKNLLSIQIPNSVTSIGKNAFSSWSSSQTINIDNTEEFINSNWDSNWKDSSSAQINYLRS